jgi:hypothetical protein
MTKKEKILFWITIDSIGLVCGLFLTVVGGYGAWLGVASQFYSTLFVGVLCLVVFGVSVWQGLHKLDRVYGRNLKLRTR